MYQKSEKELTLPTNTAKHTNPKLDYLSIRQLVKLSITLAVNPSSSGLEKTQFIPKKGSSFEFYSS